MNLYTNSNNAMSLYVFSTKKEKILKQYEVFARSTGPRTFSSIVYQCQVLVGCRNVAPSHAGLTLFKESFRLCK